MKQIFFSKLLNWGIILVSIITFGYIMQSCQTEDNTLALNNNLEYSEDSQLSALADKYSFEIHSVDISQIDIPSEKICSIEEFEQILDQLNKLKGKSIPIEIDKSLNIPRLKSGNENGGSSQVAISGSNEELTAKVFLNLTNKTVINSTVSFKLPSSLYLMYNHDGGSCSGEETLNFNAYGTITVFVAIHDVVVTTAPTMMSGYYNITGGTGELTYF